MTVIMTMTTVMLVTIKMTIVAKARTMVSNANHSDDDDKQWC